MLLATPAGLLEEAPTSKIILEGGDLKTPAVIRNPKILKNFQPWAVPPGQSFLADWSQATIGSPQEERRYKVSFYIEVAPRVGRLIYAVYYVFDLSTDQGYVYLPRERRLTSTDLTEERYCVASSETGLRMETVGSPGATLYQYREVSSSNKVNKVKCP